MYNPNTLYAWIKRKSSCLHDHLFRNIKRGSAYHNEIHNLTEQILVEFVCQQRSWAQKMPQNPSCFGSHSEEGILFIFFPIVVQRKPARKASFHSLIGLADSAKPDCRFSEYCASLDNLQYQIVHHEVDQSCSETEYNLRLWKNTARFNKVPLYGFNLWHHGGQEELPNTGCLWTEDGKVETAQLKQPGELLRAFTVNF